MHKKDRISVVWLDNGEVCSDFATSIMDSFMANPGRLTGRIVVRSGGAITGARNRAIAEYLSNSEDEWALLIDSDMKWTPADLKVLIDAADAKTTPVVGGLCFIQMGQMISTFQMIVPTIYNDSPLRRQAYQPIYDYAKDSLIECDATGAAFLLVHRSVLLKIQEMTGQGDWSWFMEGPTQDGLSWLGEDVTFCTLVKMAGFPLHVHTGCKVGHIKGVNYVLDEEMYLTMYQGATQANVNAANVATDTSAVAANADA